VLVTDLKNTIYF